MKSILLSIKPKYVELIASGEKIIEVRKSAPKEVPFKCYIYESRNGGHRCKHCNEKDSCYSYAPKNVGCYNGRGKVIGEFICDRIEMVNAKCSDYGIDLFYHDCLTNGCLTEREIEKYFNVPEDRDLRAMKGNGYVWNISDLKIYDKPRELSEFSRPCSYSGLCFSCKRTSFKKDGNLLCNTKITRPPQSWMHVEDLGEEE
jgi:predicted transcriptional regulator|nr:MAG TPA: hypothetical protein [Caudoviricetes sp.]